MQPCHPQPATGTTIGQQNPLQTDTNAIDRTLRPHARVYQQSQPTRRRRSRTSSHSQTHSNSKQTRCLTLLHPRPQHWPSLVSVLESCTLFTHLLANPSLEVDPRQRRPPQRACTLLTHVSHPIRISRTRPWVNPKVRLVGGSGIQVCSIRRRALSAALVKSLRRNRRVCVHRDQLLLRRRCRHKAKLCNFKLKLLISARLTVQMIASKTRMDHISVL